MGTTKHSIAAKKRMRKIPKDVLKKRMAGISRAGWDALDPKARRKRALKSARTKKANLINKKI